MLLSVSLARPVLIGALQRCGVPSDASELQASVLLEAELRGLASHGLQRLPRLVSRIRKGLADPQARGEHVWKSPGFLAVDGRNGLGPVVGARAIDAIVPAARRQGIALAAVRDAHHLGMLAWYVERIVDAGMIGIALSTSEALVHPFGGQSAMLGTNPIAIGIPAERGSPFVLDLATSMVSMGKIHDHAARGLPIAEGWALDARGRPTTDATAAKGGSLAPFGGAKGYGLALAFELLVASLCASALAPDVRGTLDDEHPCNKGDVFIAIDPAGARGGAIAAYLDALRNAPRAEADRPIAIPGDGARSRRAFALEHGIEIRRALWDDLLSLSSQAS